MLHYDDAAVGPPAPTPNPYPPTHTPPGWRLGGVLNYVAGGWRSGGAWAARGAGWAGPDNIIIKPDTSLIWLQLGQATVQRHASNCNLTSSRNHSLVTAGMATSTLPPAPVAQLQRLSSQRKQTQRAAFSIAFSRGADAAPPVRKPAHAMAVNAASQPQLRLINYLRFLLGRARFLSQLRPRGPPRKLSKNRCRCRPRHAGRRNCGDAKNHALIMPAVQPSSCTPALHLLIWIAEGIMNSSTGRRPHVDPPPLHANGDEVIRLLPVLHRPQRRSTLNISDEVATDGRRSRVGPTHDPSRVSPCAIIITNARVMP